MSTMPGKTGGSAAAEQAESRRGIRLALGWSLVVLAGAAVFMSWGALYDLAVHVGGMAPERAVFFPAVVDLVTVVALLIALLVPGETMSSRALPWVTLVVFGVVTVAGNAAHVVTVSPDRLALGQVVAVFVNAVPAVALLMATHLASVTVFRSARAVVVPVEPERDARETARETAARMREAGSSYGEIATETGTPKATVARWLKPTSLEAGETPA